MVRVPRSKAQFIAHRLAQEFNVGEQFENICSYLLFLGGSRISKKAGADLNFFQLGLSHGPIVH